MMSARIAVDAVILAHDEDGLRRVARVLHDDRNRLAAGQGNSPASPQELALVQIAQGVGRVQPVGFEEGSQQGPVGRFLDDDRSIAAGENAAGHGRRPGRTPPWLPACPTSVERDAPLSETLT